MLLGGVGQLPRRFALVAAVVESGGVGVGWGGASRARSEDEFGRLAACGLEEQHVASGAVEKCVEDVVGRVGAVVAEDALVDDSAGDLDSGEAGDVAEDLVEAGVGCGDGDLTVDVRDIGAVRWGLRRCEWGCRCCCGRGGRQC